ncbi:hypothetical protein ASE11_19215 [Hydrogenophaga sp. Root209]|nr:hypothetical protein ASE11_19215 [Hydrogenophaga sp. Root209]
MPNPIQPPVLGLFDLWRRFFAEGLGNKPLDPYTIWALCTQLRALGEGRRAPSVLSFSVELDQPYEPATHTFEPLARMGVAGRPPHFQHLPVHVPSAYERGSPWDENAPGPMFVTLRLDVHDRTWEDIQRDVQALITIHYVKRLQIGQQRGVNNPDLGQRGKPAPDLPRWAHKATVLIGALEDACPFAHRALRRADEPLATRVVELWDQTTLSDGMAVAPRPNGFPYGRYWTGDALDGFLLAHTHAREVDEAAVYASAEIDSLPLAGRASHAAAVMCLLAGAGRAAPRMPQPIDEGNAAHPFGDPQDDAAARAPLAVVQLPREQTAVRAGRWLAVNALDGLHHLIDVARRLGQEAGTASPPLVVNMSYGAMAGPHDGSGMLESAIDELCLASQGKLAVVMAAGNAHGTQRNGEDARGYLPGGLHARQALEPGGSVSFTLFIPPDKQFETYLEFWFSVQGKAQDEDQFLYLDADGRHGEVDIVVEPAVGATWPALPCPGLHVVPQGGASAQVEAGLFFMRRPTQGRHRSMALLVVAATQVAGWYAAAPSGRWRITLRHKKASSDAAARYFFVDAWVERDDTEVGAVRPQSARLVENEDGTPSGLTDADTFTSIATGSKTFRVGAVMDRGEGLATEQVSAYSAAAVNCKKGPEFSAIADAHAALPGIRVSGSQSGMVLRANGTSMAAPQAARYLTNRLAVGDTLSTVRAELAASMQGTARLGKKTA